jgi:hypothetical protein
MKIISIKNIIISLSIFFAQILMAQEVDSIQKNKLTRFSNQLYLEVFGHGGLGSINYESGISGEYSHLLLSLGIGITPNPDIHQYDFLIHSITNGGLSGFELSFPLGFRYLLGKKINYWEVGGAFIPNTLGRINFGVYSGYRFQIVKERIVGRIFLHGLITKPYVFSEYKLAAPFPGMSFGYSF